MASVNLASFLIMLGRFDFKWDEIWYISFNYITMIFKPSFCNIEFIGSPCHLIIIRRISLCLHTWRYTGEPFRFDLRPTESNPESKTSLSISSLESVRLAFSSYSEIIPYLFNLSLDLSSTEPFYGFLRCLHLWERLKNQLAMVFLLMVFSV